MITENLLKPFHLTFEITVLVVYHIPRWLVSGAQIWLYEERKGNWTFGRHLRVQMKRHIPGLCQRLVQLRLRPSRKPKSNRSFTESDFLANLSQTTPVSRVQVECGFQSFQWT